MADLPREIHAIPRPGGRETETRVGVVGPKAVASAASALGGFASDVGRHEGGEGRGDTEATALESTTRAIKIRPERFRFENVGAVCALVRFSCFMRALASSTRTPEVIDTRIL
jgi:hypothetical protein